MNFSAGDFNEFVYKNDDRVNDERDCMKLTTLCYIENDGCYLMLHRNKKEGDCNQGKWIGVGGKFEADETPEECMLREVKEETGLLVTGYAYRGLITFVSDCAETEYMHLFTADIFQGEMTECEEGTLAWIPIEEIPALNLWEGDRVFLQLLQKQTEYFSLKLCYEGEKLAKALLNGREAENPSLVGNLKSIER